MRFTVFGGSGFVGSNLTRYLRTLGHEVNLPERTYAVDASYNLGHVIYAIGLTGNFRGQPFQTVEAHVSRLARLIEGSRYESWLYLSSARIYYSSNGTHELSSVSITPNSDTLYDSSKVLGESLCLSLNNPEVRVARLSNVIGIGQSPHTFLGSIFSDLECGRSLIIREAAKSAKDYISIDDVLRLLTLIATSGRERLYNVASGSNLTHQEIAGIVERICGVPVLFQKNAIVRVFPKIDNRRIQNEFNYVSGDMEEGVERLIQSFKERYSREQF